jgi:hypothetical protein
MKKRMISLFLTLCMILALLSGAAFAADSSGDTADGLHWELSGNTLTITGKGAMQDYTARGVGVGPDITEAPWAEYADTIRSVVLSNGITDVGANAFRGLPIESAKFPASLTKIGDFAFTAGLNGTLKQLSLPNGLKTIGRSAFSGAAVTTLTIPGTVQSIGDYAFSHMDQLRELRFAEGFQTWKNVEYGWAISHDYALETVYFPSTLTGLPENAFDGCNTIHDVYYTGTEADWNKLTEGFSETTTQFLLKQCEAVVHFVEADPMAAFKDLDPNGWYYDSVSYCVYHGLMNGTGSDTFSPNEGLTRAMVVTILWRLCDQPTAEKETTFTDLTQKWYRAAVAWAQESGVVNGMDDTHFAPDQNISRQDFVTILCRFLAAAGGKIETADLSGFADAADISGYARTAMAWAVQAGIINGIVSEGKTYADPRGTATRAQAAAIFMRFCETEFEFPEA